MTNLISNTHSTHQNESIKQLAIVTILFLPLTFSTVSGCGRTLGSLSRSTEDIADTS